MIRSRALFWFGFALATFVRAEPAGKFTDLGPQVTATTIQGSVFARTDAGADLVYTVARGQPGHLLGYELPSGKPVLDLPIPKTDGCWNLAVSSDGWLYLPGGEGHLFRVRPGTDRLEDLGVALAGETIIWDLSAGNDGEIFGGTYPGGRVFRYQPKEGFSDAGRGSIVAGENYVRAVAVHRPSGKVFVGVGSHAHLIELDPKTGAKRELLPEKYRAEEAAYSLGIVPDEKAGDRLLVWVTNVNQTLLYNIKTGVFERTLGTVSVKSAARPVGTRRVYFSDGTNLCTFDLDHTEQAPESLTRCAGANAMRARDDGHIDALTRSTQVVTFDPATKKSATVALHVPPQPIPLQSITLGPDGRMWMGGYLAGGHAAFDPATGRTELYKGLSQTERMAILGSRIYFGIYPHGRLYVYDTAQPWGMSVGNNPKKIADIPGQSRPIATLAVPELNKIFFGTVPEYGHLGGALVVVDADTNAIKVHEGIVAKQSIVSLVYTGGALVGGTSIWGGLGEPPAEKDAKLFGWDPRTEKKTFEFVPIAGANAITCLVNGPDKNLWGIADGTLFVFDPVKHEVLSRAHLFDVHYATEKKFVWRDAFLVAHPSGQIYGVIDSHFFRLDPQTKSAVELRRTPGLELLSMDRDGRLYFREMTHLWRYEP